ncbi:MAG: RidA family protein [Bacillota bacterium]
MDIYTIKTNGAPEAIGPYSQAVRIGNLVFTSGQIAINPKTGELVTCCIQRETEQVIENLKAVVEAAGSSLSNVIKTTLFIKNMSDFSLINETYSKYFHNTLPARSCVEVAQLPKNVNIEIEAVALIQDIP